MDFSAFRKTTIGPKKPVTGLLTNILPVVAIIILALLTWFVVKPLWANLKQKNAAVAKEKQEVIALTAKRDMLQSLALPQLGQRLSEARRALPEQKNIPGLITGLSQLTQENNLAIASLQLRPGKIIITGQEEVIIKLSVIGDLRNLDAMLKKLSQIRRIISVKKVTGTTVLSSNGFTTSLELGISALPIPDNLLGKSYADPLPDFSAEKQKLADKLATYAVYTEAGFGAIGVIGNQATAAASPSASASGSAKPPRKP